VSEHVAVQRIQRGVVDVGGEHAFGQVVEHHDASDPAEPAESTLVQFDPDARIGQAKKGLSPCAPLTFRRIFDEPLPKNRLFHQYRAIVCQSVGAS
jgi:hypothetical protein